MHIDAFFDEQGRDCGFDFVILASLVVLKVHSVSARKERFQCLYSEMVKATVLTNRLECTMV